MTASPVGCLELGRPFGVPLRVHPGGAARGLAANAALLALAVRLAEPDLSLSGWLVISLAAAALLQLSALAHEYGHALAARAVGQRVDAVVFMLFGGYAWIDLDGAERENPAHAAAIVAAGPAVSFGLALAFGAAALLPIGRELAVACSVAAALNALLLVLNLVPVGAFDGGRLLRLARGWLQGGRPASAARRS